MTTQAVSTAAAEGGLEEFREQVRSFLAEALPEDFRGVAALEPTARERFLGPWREALVRTGYLAPEWPVEYGGAGLSEAKRIVLDEELARVGAPLWPLPTDPIGMALLGPIVLLWGTPEQKRELLPRLVAGEHRWAQGFSEPEAGSDLFNLRTRAVRDGDDWVVDGHKVWQTQGHHANWIFLLARTDQEARNRDALSFLLVPLDQPGVVVSPLRTMTGETEFAEVRFDGARTAAANVVGAPGRGAQVALSLLGLERSSLGVAHLHYRAELERLVELARTQGLNADLGIRRRLAECRIKIEMMRMMSLQAREQAAAGAAPGPESSVFKLFETTFDLQLTNLAMDLLGMAGTVTTGPASATVLGPDPVGTPNSSAAWQAAYLRSRAAVIYGGSSQIQRSTLGEQVLGLPREPRPGGVRA
ncbi:acyl-CoA dehydrogenase family protein [Mumia sp. DW29H23]|uniref:acyl-CoA dehydrogenase family protein n=1 Tax=Mumia sp. DW29H23 TaxID=3421241 RepID=UPI003D685E30